jgi:hypothetical protein
LFYHLIPVVIQNPASGLTPLNAVKLVPVMVVRLRSIQYGKPALVTKFQFLWINNSAIFKIIQSQTWTPKKQVQEFIIKNYLGSGTSARCLSRH